MKPRNMILGLILLAAMIASLFTFARPTYAADTDVVIEEVNYRVTGGADWIRIRNTGATTIDVSNWWFCSLFSYNQLSNLTPRAGDDLMLSPGEKVDLGGFALNDTAADLGLYANPSFGSSTDMVDFVQWGSGGNGRESVAVTKGVWTTGDFVATAAADQAMKFDGSNGGGGLLTLSSDFTNGAPTAVTLQNVVASGATSGLLVVLTVLLITIGLFVMVRRRQTA